ncbi:MAG: rhodanese-like domain-containing protein [Burkholderiaceae bacterium]
MAKTERLHDASLDVYTAAEVKQMLDANEIVLIDVRTPAEFMFEHVPGALLYPMSGFDAAKLPTQEGKRIVFHCGSGLRSRRIAERCHAAGVAPLAHMEGGFAAWKQAGFKYYAIDPATGSVTLRP